MSKKREMYEIDGEMYYVHDPYQYRWTGKKDAKWYMRFLDYIFQYENRRSIITIFDNFFCYVFGACFVFGVIEKIYFDGSHIIHGAWISVILVFSPISRIYRYYRHRYFKRNKLPGPYGWGHLDEFSGFCESYHKQKYPWERPVH